MMHVAERQDYHLIDDLWFSYKILKIPNFCWRFSCHHHFRHRPQPGPDFSKIDLVWQQMIDFSNIANLFDSDGGSYSYLDFKKWSLSNFEYHLHYAHRRKPYKFRFLSQKTVSVAFTWKRIIDCMLQKWQRCRPRSDCGWLDRTMVLGSFQCQGVLLLWHMVGQGPAELAAGGLFFSLSLLFFFHLVYAIFLICWETAGHSEILWCRPL